MTEKMLRFVGIKKETPAKLESSERTSNFHEIYREFIETKASEQASRCSQCGTPFCQVHCPLHN
ncbi:MAG: NAD(P)-dependent oxidoreductase, partial [Proteobacteria bacterium]|nr:NAD(P)-dependent oxidoreductase [Pseudomonadota bacterium]